MDAHALGEQIGRWLIVRLVSGREHTTCGSCNCFLARDESCDHLAGVWLIIFLPLLNSVRRILCMNRAPDGPMREFAPLFRLLLTLVRCNEFRTRCARLRIAVLSRSSGSYGF